jgi:hypothetical protein
MIKHAIGLNIGSVLSRTFSIWAKNLVPFAILALIIESPISIGTRLLVIPGLIAMCVFYVAIPAAVVERLGVGAAIGRSASLTKGVRGAIFGLAFILGLVAGGVILAMMFLLPILDLARAQRLELGAEGPDGVADFVRDAIYRLRLRTALSQVAGAILGLLTSIASVIVYYDLRSQKEQIDIERIAAVFD